MVFFFFSSFKLYKANDDSLHYSDRLEISPARLRRPGRAAVKRKEKTHALSPKYTREGENPAPAPWNGFNLPTCRSLRSVL